MINAGDGTNEHPTQALLDAATIRHRFGRVEGLKIAICGDIKHSRVARSNAKLLPRLGAEVRLAGPPELMPDGIPPLSIDEAIDGADVVMMLRVQRERLEEDLGDAPGEYLARYGLTAERLARAAPDAAVMHPGPMNRGVEIDGALADDPERSLITLQVEMGVAVEWPAWRCCSLFSARRIGPAHRRRSCGRSSCRRGSSASGSGRCASRWLSKPVNRQAPEDALGRIEPGPDRQISAERRVALDQWLHAADYRPAESDKRRVGRPNRNYGTQGAARARANLRRSGDRTRPSSA